MMELITECLNGSLNPFQLMNRSFYEGTFPDVWRIANTIPIFKNGDESLPSKYGPLRILRLFPSLFLIIPSYN